MNSIRVTFLYVFASVPVKLIFGLLIAYLLTRNIKGTTFFRSLYYVPSLIGGSISIALVWRELFSKRVSEYFPERLGAPALSWFSDQKLVMIPLVLMSAWQFGSAMIIFAAGIKEIPGSYYEAAEIDGANKWQTFYKITLPLLSPIILYNLVMQTIAAFMTLRRHLSLPKVVRMMPRTFMLFMCITKLFLLILWGMLVLFRGSCC